MKELLSKDSILRRRLSRIFIWFPAMFLVTSLLLFSILQFPYFQTRFINEVSFILKENTGFNLSIGHANLTWYDHMILEDVRLFDKANDSTLLSARSIQVDIELSALLLNNQLKADLLEVESPRLHTIKYNDSTDLNISKFLSDLKLLFKKKNTAAKKKTAFIFDEVRVTNGLFTFNDIRKSPLASGKDYYHFAIDSIDAELSQLTFANDSLGFHADQFTSIDPGHQLDLRSFQGNFSYTKTRMTLFDFQLKTDRSTLSDSLVFKYRHPGNFKYFNDSISFYAKLAHTSIHSEDLALFNDKLAGFNQSFGLSGIASGLVKRLNLDDFKMTTGNRTFIEGDAECYGLPILKETFVNLKLHRSSIWSNDIESLTPGKAKEYLAKTTHINIGGHFLGFPNDFVANATVTSPIGKVDTDINFKIDNQSKAWYDGLIEIDQLDLEPLTNRKEFQKLSMKGSIKGSGLRLDNAKFDLKAAVDSVEINNYKYKEIKTSGHFESEYFDGEFAIKDHNAQFDGLLSIDLRNDKNKIKIKGSLDTLNLKPIGILKQDLSLGTTIDIDMQGSEMSELIGYISLNDNYISYDSSTLEIDTISVLSSLLNEHRIIHFETDGLSGQLDGQFQNAPLIKTLQVFYQEIMLKIENDSAAIENYYLAKSKNPVAQYDMNITLNAWDLNQFIQPFKEDFYASKNISLEGSFKQDSIYLLSLFTNIDTLSANGYTFYQNEVDFNVSKEFYSEKVVSALYLSSANQKWSDKYSSENIYADIIWNEDSIMTTLNVKQDQFLTDINLMSKIKFENDGIYFQMIPSKMELLNKAWHWNPSNTLGYNDNEWTFDKMNISNSEESIGINGTYSLDSLKTLNVNIQNFELANFQQISKLKIEGIIDGNLKIQRTPIHDIFEGELNGNALKIEDFLLGNIRSKSKWNNTKRWLETQASLLRDSHKRIDISGNLQPQNQDNQLNLQVDFDSANLDLLEPFLQANFTNIKGFSSGYLQVDGTFSKPVIRGRGDVISGEVHVNYLNTNYAFEGPIHFNETSLNLDNLQLKDNENNRAQLNGQLNHENFKKFNLDVSGNFRNFQILNTTAAQNTLYYGTAYGTGTINFSGPLSRIKIDAKAITEKGTRLSVPLGNLYDYNVDKKEYISFVDLNTMHLETDKQEKETKSKKIKGMDLNFDIELTTDAYLELIFDYQTGDIIRGRGDGNINLQMNTDGDFKMFGDYEIDNGGYNFTLYNIINKEFAIQKASTISWYGDPYGGQLNILAKYRQLTSLTPILGYSAEEVESSTDSELRTKYPSTVNLNLTGKLLTPDIKFGIDIEDYPREKKVSSAGLTLEEIITAFKVNLQSNEQEMNRQVFSLIILRAFSPENSFQVNGTTIGTSFSEFLSNQLSYWATQVDENLEIDVDLAGLDRDAFNTFQLRLSYTFLDGRLRVTRGGGIPNQENKEDISALIGDWTVEYLLTKDGRLRAKMFSRTDVDNITSSTEGNNFETGFSLQYVKSFDELKQILSANRDKNLDKSAPQ